MSTTVNHNWKNNILKPTKFKPRKIKIAGFDIETHNKNKSFTLGSIITVEKTKVFKKKEDMINEFARRKYCGFWFCATNLSFDFMGLFFGNENIKHFKFIWNGSRLISAVVYIKDNKFCDKKDSKHCIRFVDSMNYAALSVEEMGKIIKQDKLKHPKFLGNKPKNKEEWDTLEKYNINDSEITFKFMKFLFNAFNELGVEPRLTLASVSKRLFTNQYLKRSFKVQKIEELLDIFESYCGGRTECFSRGFISSIRTNKTNIQYRVYDINSMYPDVMRNKYPNPESCHVRQHGNIKFFDYDGISYCKIFAPYMKYPILPLKTDEKLLFPTGEFSGWFTHAELNYAIQHGYKILELGKQYYYTESDFYFNDFVTDLYAKRKELQKENNPMEYVYKLILNMGYGKYGEKFWNKDSLLPLTMENIDKYQVFDRIGEYMIVKQCKQPANHCIPIWASYVTSYARIKLHKLLVNFNAIYCDTDSVITTCKIPESNQLGELKLESEIDHGFIVKPKMYGLKLKNNKHDSKIKIKGCPVKFKYHEFVKLLEKPSVKYVKFTKFREALRRNKVPNELIDMEKIFSLDDNKRNWEHKFTGQYEESTPLCMINAKQKQILNKDLIIEAVTYR